MLTGNNTDAGKAKFKKKIKNLIEKYNIPPNLVINFDEIQIPLMSGLGLSDTSNYISIVIGVSMSGVLLPIQIIFAGSDKTCFPIVQIPDK